MGEGVALLIFTVITAITAYEVYREHKSNNQ